jgi:hypothetical protein
MLAVENQEEGVDDRIHAVQADLPSPSSIAKAHTDHDGIRQATSFIKPLMAE